MTQETAWRQARAVLTDPVTRPARPGRLARSALLLLVAVAVAAPAWSQTPTVLIKNTRICGKIQKGRLFHLASAMHQEFSTGAYPDGYTITAIAILLRSVQSGSAMRASVWTTSSGLPTVKQFDLTSPSLGNGGNWFTAPANSTLDASQTYCPRLDAYRRSMGGSSDKHE